MINTRRHEADDNDISVLNRPITYRTLKQRHQELSKATHNIEYLHAKDARIKFIDLFAGVGGIRLAFEKAGAKCLFSSEIDTHAQLTYFANHGVVPFGDITTIDPNSIPHHEILCAGFPCQPFSHIGKREGFKHPTLGTMFYEIVRILEVKRPQAILLENVPGIVNHDRGNTLQVILETLEGLNYTCTYTVLNACDFGVPQNRKRFYLVAFLGKRYKFRFPNPPMRKADIGAVLEQGVKGYSISEHLQREYLFKKEDGRPIVIDSSTKGPMKTLVASYHKIQRLTGTFVEDGETGLRLLSENECKRAMGFPDKFKFPVSRTQMYRQMGNSVVIPVVSAIAAAMCESLAEKQARPESF